MIACTSVLSILSILLMYGIRDANTVSGLGLLKMQLAATVVGFICMLFISTLDYVEVVNKLWIPFLIGEIALLGLTLVFGLAQGENRSWLNIGPVRIQPSEFVKLTYIITFSKHLDLVKHKINRLVPLLTLAAHAGIVIGLILLSGDLGVALVYVGFTLVMLYEAGLSIFYFLGGIGAAVLALPYVWPHLREDQRLRIIYGFSPEKDPLDKGMQPLLGRTCVSNGGWFGNGVSGGSYYKNLYACENDFAFSSLCEKFGIIGGISVLLLLCILVIRLFSTAISSRKDTGAFICIGIAGTIIVQTAENVGMCLALLPVVGITLPFISYGGSSIFSMYLMMGVAHSIHAHKVKYFFEREGH